MQPTTLSMVSRAVQSLIDATGQVRFDTTNVLGQDHVAVIRHYDQVRLATEQIKQAREALNEIEDRLSKEYVPDAMRKAGVKTITVEGVGRVSVSHRWSASIIDKDKGYNWLRESGNESLITETVNSSTLSAFAKDMFENQGVELPPAIFKMGTMAYTSITKVK